jgi:hypothetical protein
MIPLTDFYAYCLANPGIDILEEMRRVVEGNDYTPDILGMWITD